VVRAVEAFMFFLDLFRAWRLITRQLYTFHFSEKLKSVLSLQCWLGSPGRNFRPDDSSPCASHMHRAVRIAVVGVEDKQ